MEWRETEKLWLQMLFFFSIIIRLKSEVKHEETILCTTAIGVTM